MKDFKFEEKERGDLTDLFSEYWLGDHDEDYLLDRIETIIQSRADAETKRPEGDWKLVGHSFQIADTGDYDGHYEITDGKVSILTKDDDDEALEPIVDALNESGCKFYLDENEVDWLRHENKILKEDLAELRKSRADADGLADKDREIMHLNDVINSARAEVERLKESNDAAINEREVMMQAFKDIREAFESREWITQGRGSYKYNDDRYMEEAKYLFADFKKIESETWRQIKSKGYEYKKSIEAPLLSELAESKRRIAELEDTWTGKENGLP